MGLDIIKEAEKGNTIIFLLYLVAAYKGHNGVSVIDNIK